VKKIRFRKGNNIDYILTAPGKRKNPKRKANHHRKRKNQSIVKAGKSEATRLARLLKLPFSVTDKVLRQAKGDSSQALNTLTNIKGKNLAKVLGLPATTAIRVLKQAGGDVKYATKQLVKAV
jgi:hypothetical protein